MSSGDIAKSLGHHGMWGFSASFDFLEALTTSKVINSNDKSNNSSTAEPIKILLLHPGDIRHILTTISRRRRHKHLNRRPIHFYVLESPMEVISRNLVMLELLNDYEVPIRQRANAFLEVLGNAKVQVRTGKYLEQLGYQVQQLLATGKGRLENLLDFSNLKYKERDQLEDCLKQYSRRTIFDMESLRDHRMRGLYAERYDARKSLSDWDWHAGIKPTASIIHVKLFKEWRLSGIAFEFGDQSYTESNRTMMTYVEGVMKRGKSKSGEHQLIKGYWSDISVSPYISFGIDCFCPGEYEEGLFEIMNKDTGTEQHRHHAAEVSVFNLLAHLWEIETGEIYSMKRKNDIFSGLGSEAKTKPVGSGSGGGGGGDTKINDDKKEDGNDLEVIHEDDENDMNNENSDDNGDNNNDTPPPPPPPVQPQPPSPPEYISSPYYNGCKIGYVFKLGDSGVGYYIDALRAAEAHRSGVEIDGGSGLSPPPSSSSDNNINNNNDTPTPLPPPAPAPPPTEAEMIQMLKRAENILESYNNIKVLPLAGDTTTILSRSRYKNMFDGVYISSRSVQLMENSFFKEILSDNGAVVVAENSKFLVPLGKDAKAGYEEKVNSFAEALELTPLRTPPVTTRYRDERDKKNDKLFYKKNSSKK